MKIEVASEMKRFNRTAIAGGSALALVIGLSACTAGGLSEADDQPRTLTLAIQGVPNSFDPAELAGGGEGLSTWMPVYDTLIKLLPDGELAPGLATEWTYDESLTTLTMDLRAGVEFSDGAVFDADAVKANIDHFKAGTGTDLQRAAAISEVVVEDEDTVQLRLSGPDPALLVALTGPVGAMGSPAALANETIELAPVGSGPYELDAAATTTGSVYAFARRDIEHWDADSWSFDRIVLRVIPDETARANALQSGEIDGAQFTAAAAGQIESAGLPIVRSSGDFFGLGIFDRAGGIQPALADVRVRQAINYAFDREEILASINQGYGTVTNQIFGVETPGWDAKLDEFYDYDPERARELMAEAGYADGFDVTIPDFGAAPLNPVLQDRLGAIGIRVEFEPVAPTEAFAALFGGKYPMFAMQHDPGLGGEPWTMIAGTLLPDSPWNMLRATDPELDALIAAARGASTPEEKDTTYHAVNEWIVENAWFAPLYKTDSLFGHSADIQAPAAKGNVVPLIWSIEPAN